MNYLSTRGQAPTHTFSEILLGGLAPDGGLYLPERYPRFGKPDLARLRGMGYAELAHEILRLFAADIPAADLKSLVDSTYTAKVFRYARPGGDPADITPLYRLGACRAYGDRSENSAGRGQVLSVLPGNSHSIAQKSGETCTGQADLQPIHRKPDRLLGDGLYLLALSNGPTLAFKDMAMQLLGNLFEYVLTKRGEEINILGATSGDTGSAAEYALRGKKGVRVFMLSPHGKMSAFQRAQMYSLQDPNIFNIAIEGLFDDCQDIVKAVSNDAAFKAKYKIGAVNSINWARVAAQIVYYFKGYFAATQSDDEEVSFAVPSGNFGNVCAGHIARQMGLPIRRLIVATNENDVLDEFFRTGSYRPRSARETFITSSPSMDISRASNFERFVFDLVGRDATVLRALWEELATRGRFDLAGTPYFARVAEFGFVSGTSRHADRLATIRKVFDTYGVMIDTHTADGVKVGLEWREPGIPLVCLETAQAVKFEETIQEALGRAPQRPAALEGIEKLPQRFDVLPADAERVKAYIAARV